MRVTASTFMGTSGELREAATRFHFPHLAESEAVLRDYVDMARRRKDLWWAHADLQVHLAMSLSVELTLLQQFREEEVTTDSARRELHFRQQAVKAVVNGLTQVADGIAFRFHNYDLGLCQAYLINSTSPFAVKQEGFLNVLDVSEMMLDMTGPSAQLLICDLNSITNVGDFILKTPAGLQVVEVKRGKKTRGSRFARQSKRLSQLSDFLNQRKGILDDVECELLTVPCRTHNFGEVANAFSQASKEGIAVRQITPYQSITCVDAAALRGRDSIDAFRWSEQETKRIWGEDRVIEVSSLASRQWAGNLVPMTVFPLDSALIAALLTGQKIFISSISLEALFSFVGGLGWDVIDLTETDMENQPFAAPAFGFLINSAQPDRTCALSVDYLNMCASNFINIETVLNPAKELGEQRSGPFTWVPSFEGESAIWD